MRKIIPFLFVLTVLMAACSSIDCPLSNKVQTKYMLKGKVTTLKDTLTISTARPAVGSDSVLLNRYINTPRSEWKKLGEKLSHISCVSDIPESEPSTVEE